MTGDGWKRVTGSGWSPLRLRWGRAQVGSVFQGRTFYGACLWGQRGIRVHPCTSGLTGHWQGRLGRRRTRGSRLWRLMGETPQSSGWWPPGWYAQTLSPHPLSCLERDFTRDNTQVSVFVCSCVGIVLVCGSYYKLSILFLFWKELLIILLFCMFGLFVPRKGAASRGIRSQIHLALQTIQTYLKLFLSSTCDLNIWTYDYNK